MLRTRVIPCLLIQGDGLVKTVKFKSPTYVGDPTNAIRIFNTKEVDELVVLDIGASPGRKEPQFDRLAEITGECFMPLCYGGGVTTIEQMARIFALGVEKVALNTSAAENASLVRQAANRFGSQSIVVSIDVKKRLLGGYEVVTRGASCWTGEEPARFAAKMQSKGAGEILLTSVDRDGTGIGYDNELISKVSSAVSIPVIACGGAGSLEHMAEAVRSGASAVAAGSMFVFHGRRRAVLISYPAPDKLKAVLP